jgi:pyridoxal phosphate enzyme (YggS family)
MSLVIDNLKKIKHIIKNDNVKIIAVSKSFKYEHIRPLVEYGHPHFGENKVQEAISKWSKIKEEKTGLKLHMIGRLQSNKAREAVNLFDYIHSVDSPKLASLLFKYENILNIKRKYFIQVNMGREKQKSGVQIELLDTFYNYCTRDLKLDIVGLMAIPPNDGNERLYFKKIYELNQTLGLKELSMGMSGNFKEALDCGTTCVRIGTGIFGNRD